MNKNTLRNTFCLMLSVLVLSACASAPPETRAGEWKGTTDFGNFTMFVEPDGLSITKIEYSFQSCSKAIISGSATISGTLARKDGAPITNIENGKFTIEVTGLTTISFDGKFNPAGTTLSGKWVAGACSGRWTTTR